MTPLSKGDEARVGAIIHELRQANPDDPYAHDILDELERTVDNAGISPGLGSLSPDRGRGLGP